MEANKTTQKQALSNLQKEDSDSVKQSVLKDTSSKRIYLVFLAIICALLLLVIVLAISLTLTVNKCCFHTASTHSLPILSEETNNLKKLCKTGKHTTFHIVHSSRFTNINRHSCNILQYAVMDWYTVI